MTTSLVLLHLINYLISSQLGNEKFYYNLLQVMLKRKESVLSAEGCEAKSRMKIIEL